jgi:protein TonB
MEVALKQQTNKKILYIFGAVSVLIHLSISGVYINENGVKDFLSSNKQDEQKILIKLMNQKSDNLKQVAQTEQSKSEKLNKPRFHSNKNNSFDRETRNANNGTFQAAGKGQRNAVAQKDLQVHKRAKKKKLKDLKFSDLAFKTDTQKAVKKIEKVAKVNQTRKGLENGTKKGIGLGQTNDFLEDIPLGDFTRLNTQEFEYYGFYHRIRQKLEQFWGSNIQEQADKIFKQGRSIASESNLITGLTIMLNSEGEIVDILIKSTSGMKELDDAAIQSFNQAGPFPNPPRGMLKNGKAVIEWGFVVNT